MSIATNCLIVNVSIGQWSGHRLDKAASDAFAAEHGAQSDAGRYNKHLVPKEYLDPITKIGTEIRGYIKTHTVPWRDNGDRLLSRKSYEQFMQGLATLKQRHADAVEHFLTVDYPKARDQAEFRMGDLFNPADYPPAGELRHRFYVELDIDTVTEAGDIRVGLSEQERAEVAQQIERNMEVRVNRAVHDVWHRLASVVERYARQMREGKRLHKSLTENVHEIVELLPALNILDDPDLEAMGQEVHQRLAGYDLKDLKKDEDLRAEAASEADEIMERMRGFMSAMGQ